MKKKNIIVRYLFPAFVFLSVCGAVFVVSRNENGSVMQISKAVFPVTHFNFIPPPVLQNFFGHKIYLYGIVYFAVGIVFIAVMFIGKYSRFDRLRIMAWGCIFALLILGYLRMFVQMDRVVFFSKSAGSDDQALKAYYGNDFLYAREVKKIIYPDCKAVFITDVQGKHASTKYFTLRYFLYPIEVQKVRSKNSNVLLFFEKKNAAEAVPPGYQIAQVFNNRNLIAVAEDKE